MSDSPQGPGWWQASDGKYYPPEQAPGYTPAASGVPAAGAGVPGAPIDIGQCFTWSWAKFQANLQPLLILGAVVGGVPFVISVVSGFVGSGVFGLALLGISIVAGFILSLLTVQAGLEVAQTGTLNQQTMFTPRANVGTFVITSIIFGIMAILGICPGLCIGLVFVYLIFGLWSYAVVDEGKSPMDALNRSKELTMGPGLGTTFVPMLVFLIFAGGGLFLGGGSRYGTLLQVFFAPFGSLIGAYIWKGLKGETVAA